MNINEFREFYSKHLLDKGQKFLSDKVKLIQIFDAGELLKAHPDEMTKPNPKDQTTFLNTHYEDFIILNTIEDSQFAYLFIKDRYLTGIELLLEDDIVDNTGMVTFYEEAIFTNVPAAYARALYAKRKKKAATKLLKEFKLEIARRTMDMFDLMCNLKAKGHVNLRTLDKVVLQ